MKKEKMSLFCGLCFALCKLRELFHFSLLIFLLAPTIRSAQRIFEKAVCQAGIKKEVSIHSLRHTFATHLLEDGTDIRYIQALLGHSNTRTTERYTRIAKGRVLNIKSPLDSIH